MILPSFAEFLEVSVKLLASRCDSPHDSTWRPGSNDPWNACANAGAAKRVGARGRKTTQGVGSALSGKAGTQASETVHGTVLRYSVAMSLLCFGARDKRADAPARLPMPTAPQIFAANVFACRFLFASKALPMF